MTDIKEKLRERPVVLSQAPYEKGVFIAITMVLCLVGRMCNIFPLCAIYNMLPGRKEADRVPFNDQIVMVRTDGHWCCW